VQRNPESVRPDGVFPDCAEPVIGRAFVRPVGFIRATGYDQMEKKGG